MSDTPRTDAACGWPWGHHGRIECGDLKWSPDGPFVHSEVARQLERENAALRRAFAALREALPAIAAGYFEHSRSQTPQERAMTAAFVARKDPCGDDPIMRQHLSEGGSPT